MECRKITDSIEYLSAIDEAQYVIAQASAPIGKDITLQFEDLVDVRHQERIHENSRRRMSIFVDVSPKQVVSVAAALIPFLEHDDANRALMGSNMQRQAVPTLRSLRSRWWAPAWNAPLHATRACA